MSQVKQPAEKMFCRAQGPDGYRCELELGHEGDCAYAARPGEPGGVVTWEGPRAIAERLGVDMWVVHTMLRDDDRRKKRREQRRRELHGDT